MPPYATRPTARIAIRSPLPEPESTCVATTSTAAKPATPSPAIAACTRTGRPSRRALIAEIAAAASAPPKKAT